MAHLLSSTISRGMLEASWRKKNVSKAIKHKDTICGSGSPWTANHWKLGKYISKVSLHSGPTPSCCCLQLDADLHSPRKMFLYSQVARGKSSWTFIINCIGGGGGVGDVETWRWDSYHLLSRATASSTSVIACMPKNWLMAPKDIFQNSNIPVWVSPHKV